jgi:anti-sigma B factor antagonist
MPETPVRLSIVESAPMITALSGEIDAHTAPALAAHFATLPQGDDDFTIDMSGVDFMDSSGLRVVIELHQRAEAETRRLLVRKPSSPVARLLEISGLSDHLHVVD